VQVTLALATFRGFPWRKVPSFILAQILGALCGAAIVYGDYYHAISLFEGGSDVRTVMGPTATAPLFFTVAVSGPPPPISADTDTLR
jgi:aquaglyceroporin related protein